jgi:hypothetical protein
MRNWLPTPQGTVRLRGGTQMIAPVGGSLDYTRVLNPDQSRVIMFRTKDNLEYALILSNGFVYPYDKNGALSATATNYVVNGTFDFGSANWTLAPGQGVSGSWFQTIGDPGWVPRPPFGVMVAAGSIRQSMAIPGGDFVLRLWLQYPDPLAKNIRIRLGTTENGNDILDEDLTQAFDTGRFYEYSVTGLSAGTIWIMLSTSNGSPYMDDIQFVRTDGGLAEIASPWTDAQLVDVQYVHDVANDRVIFVHPNVAPWVLTYGAGTFSGAAAVFTNQPSFWELTNWPGVVEYYQGRLWFSGTPNQKNTFNASKSGFPFDLTTGANPGDGFQFNAATKNGFKWLRGSKTMLAGTELSEISITASSTVVSSGDIQLSEESAFGSSGPAENIGDQTVYVSPDRRKVRALLFNLNTDGYVSTDVTFAAEHITAGVIKELIWLRDPDPTIALVLKDGTMAMCLYDRQKMAAWWKLSVAGTIHSAAYSVVEPAIWMLVTWTVSGLTTLERLDLSDSEATRYMDSWVSVTPSNGVVVLSHFQPHTSVLVLKDGEAGTDTVDTPGSLTGDYTGITQVVVGLPYPESLVKPMPLEGGQPGGSAQGLPKRRFGLQLRLNDSGLPLVNGRRAPDRGVGSNMDTPEPRYTGDVTQTQLGWTDDASVEISQDLPIRTEVCAIFGQTAVRSV